MKKASKYNELDQTATTPALIGSKLGVGMCDYVLVLFDTPVSAPTITIKGSTDELSGVVLHTEATLAANKTVRLNNAGAYKNIYAELTNTAGDKCNVELVGVWLGPG